MTDKTVIYITQLMKRALLLQLEQLSTLMLSNDASFFTKDLKLKPSKELDKLVVDLLNLSATEPQIAVNGIDDLVFEITLQYQEELVNLLTKNKNLFIEQKDGSLLIHLMTDDQKRQLARCNKEMCKKLLDLPIKNRNFGPPAIQNGKADERDDGISQHDGALAGQAQDQATIDENKLQKLQVKDRPTKNVEALLEDEITFEFKIGNLAQLRKKKRILQCSRPFYCKGIPWFLQFELDKGNNHKPEIWVRLLCDYDSMQLEDVWWCATKFELRLLSHADSVADKQKTLTHIFNVVDEG